MQISNINFKSEQRPYQVNYNNRKTPQIGVNQGTNGSMPIDDFFIMQAMERQKAQKKEQSKERWYKTGIIAQVGLAVAFGVMAAGTIFSLVKQHGKGPKLSDFKFIDIGKKENFPSLADDCVNPQVREFIATMKSRVAFSEEICKVSGSKAPEQYLLMYGPSGTGKTFSAKLMAKELGAEYAEVQFADVSSPYIGQTSVEIKKVFDNLIEKANKEPDKKFLVAFNEIDALLVPRERCGANNLHLAENRTAFLNGLDMLSQYKNVKIVGTTNVDPHSGNLDKASLSRFGNMLEIKLPTQKEVIASLKFHLQGCEAVKKHKFFKTESENIEEFAALLVENKYSQRDIEKLVEIAKTKFGIAIRDSKNLNNEKFDVKYLQQALEAKGKTTGSI